MALGDIPVLETKSVTKSESNSRNNDMGLQKRVEENRGIAMFMRFSGKFPAKCF